MLLLTVAALACTGTARDDAPSRQSPVASRPSVRVLGTVQDGGLPHAACRCDRCEAARREPSRRRRIASLAVLTTEPDQLFLVDATPDLRQQLDVLSDVRDEPADRVDRAPVSGVLLTHAHIGHYTGLAFFGFEAVHTRGLPVFCSAPMARYLTDNGPWSQLVSIGNIALTELTPGAPVELGGGVTVTPVSVPHRDEYADTFGFRIEGPSKTVLYLPDTDSWDAFDTPIPQLLEGVDVAILDGTFFSADELPGREVSEIGHPLIVSSMDLLEPVVGSGKTAVYFTHLNHSNPALDPLSAERRQIESRGFAILEEGQEFPL